METRRPRQSMRVRVRRVEISHIAGEHHKPNQWERRILSSRAPTIGQPPISRAERWGKVGEGDVWHTHLPCRDGAIWDTRPGGEDDLDKPKWDTLLLKCFTRGMALNASTFTEIRINPAPSSLMLSRKRCKPQVSLPALGVYFCAAWGGKSKCLVQVYKKILFGEKPP